MINEIAKPVPAGCCEKPSIWLSPKSPFNQRERDHLGGGPRGGSDKRAGESAQEVQHNPKRLLRREAPRNDIDLVRVRRGYLYRDSI